MLDLSWLSGIVSPYSLALFLHVAAASILLGGSVFAPFVRRALIAATTVGELRVWLGFARETSRANPAVSLVVLASGLFMGVEGGWWTDGWFMVAASAWLANALVAVLVIQRAAMVVGSAAARCRDNQVSDEVDRLRRSARWTLAADFLQANDLAMVYLMFNKPSALASGALLVTAWSILAGARYAQRAWIGRDVGPGSLTPVPGR